MDRRWLGLAAGRTLCPGARSALRREPADRGLSRPTVCRAALKPTNGVRAARRNIASVALWAESLHGAPGGLACRGAAGLDWVFLTDECEVDPDDASRDRTPRDPRPGFPRPAGYGDLPLGWPGPDGVDRGTVSRETSSSVDALTGASAAVTEDHAADHAAVAPEDAAAETSVMEGESVNDEQTVSRETESGEAEAVEAAISAAAPVETAETRPEADVSRETAPSEAERAADALANVSRDAHDDAADLPVAGADTPLAQAVAEDARRRISLSGRE